MNSAEMGISHESESELIDSVHVDFATPTIRDIQIGVLKAFENSGYGCGGISDEMIDEIFDYVSKEPSKINRVGVTFVYDDKKWVTGIKNIFNDFSSSPEV